MKKGFLYVALCLFSISAYSQTKAIYTNPEFSTLAKDHKKLAILPFKAIVSLRPNQMKKLTPEQFEKLQKDEGKAIQSALHTYFLKKQNQKGYTVSFQDVGTTNAILKKNEISEENIDEYTSDELAKLLEVDGIISGTLNTNKPMSDGASLALGVLVGFYGSTNSGKISINIKDGKTDALLWKYDKTLSRSLGSDTNTVVNAIMRKASRKFPYIEL
ncbi:hypothetical protein QQ008_02810 [Fulvivirgaceae bacterium BMA10]|uniref:Secreted protein n=1 Tax=Splendidivirga corallicola TaxID=3051826 RepID=A0ABT8KL15_9BACT|nr:hypothetical protein [Fulvivirgaceae bacterium BMA10]